MSKSTFLLNLNYVKWKAYCNSSWGKGLFFVLLEEKSMFPISSDPPTGFANTLQSSLLLTPFSTHPRAWSYCRGSDQKPLQEVLKNANSLY